MKASGYNPFATNKFDQSNGFRQSQSTHFGTAVKDVSPMPLRSANGFASRFDPSITKFANEDDEFARSNGFSMKYS